MVLTSPIATSSKKSCLRTVLFRVHRSELRTYLTRSAAGCKTPWRFTTHSYVKHSVSSVRLSLRRSISISECSPPPSYRRAKSSQSMSMAYQVRSLCAVHTMVSPSLAANAPCPSRWHVTLRPLIVAHLRSFTSQRVRVMMEPAQRLVASAIAAAIDERLSTTSSSLPARRKIRRSMQVASSR